MFNKVSVECPSCRHVWFRKPSHPEMVYEMQGNVDIKGILYMLDKRCALCGVKFKSVDEATIDHIHPKAKGGKNHWRNYQLAHQICNVKKGAKI
jgi:5-methylcytosine-specific restriction endonuclease McrA